MTSRDFCFWLQGLFELGEPRALDTAQTDLIKRHLAMVFKHEIDPSQGTPEHQAELSALHEGKPPVPSKPAAVHHHHHHGREDVILRC